MTFASFDALFFTVSFLVPGFVWSFVLSMLVPRPRTGPQVRFMGFLTLSCINYAIWSWLLFLIFRTDFVNRHVGWTAAALLLIILVSPAMLGLLCGKLWQKQAVLRFLRGLGYRTIDPAPTAWDWHFSQGKPYWVVVTLVDGSRVYGLFGMRSFAGDDPAHRDLYLEAEFRPVETGEWAPVEDTAGVLIMSNQIAAIEFRQVGEFTYE